MQTATALTVAVLQVSLVVGATTMGHSAALVVTVTGGVRQRIILTTRGAATWIAAMAMFTGAATTTSEMLSLSVASGIDYLSAAADRPPSAVGLTMVKRLGFCPSAEGGRKFFLKNLKCVIFFINYNKFSPVLAC